MNPNEIAIYAVETKAIIQILWGLLLIMAITLVALSIMYVLLRLKLRSNRRREGQLARTIAAKSEEIGRLEARIAEYVELEEGVEELKAEVRRADAIRGKSEKRLRSRTSSSTRCARSPPSGWPSSRSCARWSSTSTTSERRAARRFPRPAGGVTPL